MSCHTPSIPLSSSAAYFVCHHALVAARVKSGKAAQPGHTVPCSTRPLGVAHEVVALDALAIELEALVAPHRGIHDRDQPHAARSRTPRQARDVPEARLVEGEDAEGVHVVDVEVERRDRDPSRDEAVEDVGHRTVGAPSPPGVVVAERPTRRHRRVAEEVRSGREHRVELADRHVGDERAVVHVDGHPVRGVVDRADGDVGLERVLVERPHRAGGVQPHGHGDRAVERVLAGPPRAARVAVPQSVRPAGQVERARLLPEPAQPLLVAKDASQHSVRATQQWRALDVATTSERVGQPHPVVVHVDAQERRRERRPLGGTRLDANLGGRDEHGVARRDVARRTTRAPGEPDEVVRERVHVQRRALERGREPGAVAQLARTGEPPGVDGLAVRSPAVTPPCVEQ